MAALTATNPTLLDVQKATAPDGTIADLVPLLVEDNDILLDATYIEANGTTSHQTTVMAGLPTVYWRQFNEGTPNSKGTRVQVTEGIGMLNARASLDEDLATLNGNSQAYRLQEDMFFVEAMNQEMAETTVYGNDGTEPAAFPGIATRYNDYAADNADNIILGGSAAGQVDNASIFLMTWSPQTCHFMYPKGSPAGLQVNDLGLQDEFDAANNRYRAWMTHYKWFNGLSLRDWRTCGRIPNIDKSLLTNVYTAGQFSTGADLPDLIGQLIDRIKKRSGRRVLYMSPLMKSWLRRQVEAKLQGSTLQREDVGGIMSDTFQGIPIRTVDALSADESRISNS